MPLAAPDDPTPFEAALLGRPETRLLVAALHADRSGLAAEVSRAVADGVEWPGVLAAARAHRVVPHVARTLGAEPAVPAGARAQLQQAAVGNARRQLALAGAARHVRGALDAAGVPSLVLKGPPLATWLYGDPGRRTSRDVDVLVAPAAVPAAVAAVRAAGFDAPAVEGDLAHRLLTPAEAAVVVDELGDNDVPFLHPGFGVLLELHWRPFLDARLRHVSAALEAGLTTGPAAGAGPEAAVVAYVLAHGAFHGYRRLGWLADAAALADRASSDAWDRALALARADGIELAALLGPFLAERLFGAALTPGVRDRLAAREGALRRLARLCVDADGLRTDDAHRVRLALYDRTRDRARYVWDRFTRPYRTDLPDERLDVGRASRLRRRLWRPVHLLARHVRR